MNVPRETWVELALRGAAAALLSVFAWRVYQAYQLAPQLGLLLLLAGECLSVLLVLVARWPATRDTSPIALVATAAATFYFLIAVLTGGTRLLPALVTDAVQVLGILVQIGAKLSLGRAFGLLPANRGVVAGGMYRWIRHPMYAGYLMNTLGFVLGNFTAINAAVFVGLAGLLSVRMVLEERVLRADPQYQAYSMRVRARVLPGVF